MANDIVQLIDKAQDRFQSIAPQGMAFEAEKGFAVQLLTNNSYLADAAGKNPASLLQAVTNVAAIGLSLNPAERLAYLLPRNVKSGDSWQTRIFLEPSYMGLIRLATDSGSILWVQSVLVHELDEFMDNGPGEKPTHRYSAFRDRGPLVGAYCTAKTKEGDFLTCVMTLTEIESVRDRSESWKRGKGGPWATDFGEQAKKTVIRRAFKTWPRSNMHRLALAVDLSNENEGFEPIQTSPHLPDFTLDQKVYLDQLIEAQNAIGIACLQASVEPSVWQALYHSFEKGTKGKYQRVLDELCARGKSQLGDWSVAIRDDSSLILNMIEELPPEAVEEVCKLAPDLEPEIRRVARDVL